MRTLSKWVVGVLLCCSLGTAIARNSGFDFFILVRQWGPTYCETQAQTDEPCTRAPLGLFTIHGLWPSKYDTPIKKQPRKCDDQSFDVSNLDRLLRATMACIWPSYKKPDECSWEPDECFWKHEWDAHGTCGLTVLRSQKEYFRTTVHLNEEYDINRALLNAGIDPQTVDIGAKDEVVRALADAFGAESVVTCNTEDKEDVYEIYTCFDKSLNIMDCPPSVYKCDSQLSLPQGAEVPDACQSLINSA